ncbi:FAD-dependent oxidoreductase [Clavibacter sepedonicus]|uniref:Pyridine nucleotide-disulphide oxidoreductase (Putative NADH oxidase) n=1 Tax=Clavibacter sepedonicus TaxID=31964 RepID=B0RCP5_CLASE|nr:MULTISPECIES: FAD-dependent oxidoreductase [Clavibacter]MBD5382659.1 FAD-dependent oxidoreductase [Clavibacter sp.]OQJ47479.1 CoA-disulfide reductase [Clavibacter sepedonicus]OQJ53034.1 CoA-disulfide reductase [Clavibacter sepedonicus]UUK67056.1 FAD-dependent oxidoreductase [Clavibacter sepedonicus]CAQ01816.1 putative pyridine nucleotide-disulphide oxidoreductase (putative NADH oxidase) [Clavibacter sepedonicus]
MRSVIIGGVAGGMSAATRLRRLDEGREIVVFERGAYVSFANCGLPYHVGGVIPERASLLLQTPESLAARFRLDVRVRHEVLAIDATAKTVTVRDLEAAADQVLEYDDLVIAAGAGTASSTPDGGVPSSTLRSVEDVDGIMALLDGRTDAHAVVVGAGFIGLEAVENLLARGVRVTLVQRGDQVLSPLDPEMAAPVHETLHAAEVDVRTGTTVTGGSAGHVHLSDGTRVRADLVIQAAGVHPETGLARGAGLSIGPSGGIAVDGRQRTSDPSIWAVGDGVEKIDHLDGAPTLVTMAGLANRHGRAAADDIVGAAVTDAAPALGTAILGILGITVGLVGWNEKRLVAEGRRHRIIHTHPASHAGYYPGAQQMAIKLLVDPDDDRILGAQIVGRDGVDKRLDVIAVAMTGGLTASALSRLELAYAPQYGSAKDPVNLLGYVAENAATGTTRSLQWHELEAALDAGATLVDVRTAGEHASAAIPGAVSLPLDELRARHDELPAGPLVVHCQVGQRGHTAARLLTQLGHDVRNLDGGWLTWRAGTASTTRTTAATAA